jgi:hypothetical protein
MAKKAMDHVSGIVNRMRLEWEPVYWGSYSRVELFPYSESALSLWCSLRLSSNLHALAARLVPCISICTEIVPLDYTSTGYRGPGFSRVQFLCTTPDTLLKVCVH